VKSDSEKEQSTVSVNDQSILFYIAGFIIKALKKRYYVVSSKNLTIIDKLVSHSDSSSFGTSYSEWFNKQDRGALQKKSDNFFLLVRELENIVHKSLSDRYHASYDGQGSEIGMVVRGSVSNFELNLFALLFRLSL
jgi:hypothetical protein